MAVKPPRTERARTVGHISHDARVRVDQRVKEILARREVAVQRARRAARRLKGTRPPSMRLDRADTDLANDPRANSPITVNDAGR
jgi:hypothetical protein